MVLRHKNKRPGLISRIIWLLNLLVALILLIAYLSSYVDPRITTLIAFLGLAYPFLLIINILFMLYWLIRGKLKLLLSLIVILIGYQSMIRHIQVLPGREAPAEGSIKMLSYNVQNMVHSNTGVEQADIRKGIFEFINTEKANIACIQEFSAKGGDFEGTFKEIRELTQFAYSYYANYNPRKSYRIDAMVILSNYAAINTNTLSIPGDYHNFGIYSDFIMEGDTIRVYNLHLESIRLQHEDYQFVEEVSKGQAENTTFREGSKSIIRKLHNAFKTRARQTSVVVKNLSDCPYPMIICGDFNDTPLSYAYHKISSGLEDAFVNAGHGLGNTFSGNLPPLRIDFILYSYPDFQSFDFNSHKIHLSDHYPVSVSLVKN